MPQREHFPQPSSRKGSFCYCQGCARGSEVLTPGQLPALDLGGCAEVPSVARQSGLGSDPGCRIVSGMGIQGMWAGQQGGLWAPAAGVERKKFKSPSSGSPAPNQPLAAFILLVCKVHKLRVTWVMTQVCQERHKRSCPCPFSLTVLHGTDVLGPSVPPQLHPALVPTSSGAAQPENGSEEQWLTLHGSWLLPLQLLPLAALVPRRQLSLSPAKEDNSKMVE